MTTEALVSHYLNQKETDMSKGLQTGPDLTSMVQPIPPPRFLLFTIAFLLCLPAVAAVADLNINPESPTAKSKWLRGELVIVLPDTDGGSCNDRQKDKCSAACKEAKKLSLSCEVNYDWQTDGTCTRTVICTCISANDSRLASMPHKATASEITLPDSCALEPYCATTNGIIDGPDGVDPLGVVVDDGVPF